MSFIPTIHIVVHKRAYNGQNDFNTALYSRVSLISYLPMHPFAGTPERPYHLSIGAIVLDSENKVLAHRYDTSEVPLNEAKDNNGLGVINVDHFYTVMTETPEDGEGFFDTLKRGCMEEFGAEVEPCGFIGTHLGHFVRPSQPEVLIEKHTPFFLCKLTSLDDSLRPEGAFESQSEIVSLDIDELIELLDTQFKKTSRTDFNFSEILKRAKTLI